MPSSIFFSDLINKRRMSKRIKLINRFLELTNEYKGFGNDKEVYTLNNRLQKELSKCKEARKNNTYGEKWVKEIPKDNRDIREETLKYLDKWLRNKLNYLPNSFVKDLNEVKGKKVYTNDINSIHKGDTESTNNKQVNITRGQNTIKNSIDHKQTINYQTGGNKAVEIVIPDRSVSLYQNGKVHSGKKIMRNNAFKSKDTPRVMRKANTI